MNYIEPTLASALAHLEKLTPTSKPAWGSLTPIGMVEHITDSLHLAQGKLDGVELQVPEDKLDKAIGFLHSDHPLPKHFKAPYGEADEENRNATLEDAIEEFTSNWNEFVQYFDKNPGKRHLHPSFGHLNKEEWLRLHSKHLTHHFQQFGLIPS
ncbi:MAG: DUF1569 domain-containing protein [bacterium]|nr:DUF1569 domain-containing protein [bacterium]